jgi:hypothetical protein
MKLLIHGSGFPRPFRNDPEELRCGKPAELRGNPKCNWSPSSIDWQALGQKSGGSTAAADIAGLLAAIRAQRVESIEELRIIGHSNGSFLALGGTIAPDKVVFSEDAMMGSSQTFLTAKPMFRQLQDRFKADARIVLAGCGSGGVDSDLLEMVSHIFLRTVAGFTQPILYAIDGTTAGPMVNDKTGRPIGRRIDDDARITLRGKAMYSPAANAIEDLFGSDLVGTGALRTNAWELVPDAESHAGDIFAAARRFKAHPGVIPAAEVGFKLLSEFYPARYVPGIGFAGDLVGLRVVEDPRAKGKMSMDIGKGFVDRLTPTTLQLRVSELVQAADLIAFRRTGMVPAR